MPDININEIICRPGSERGILSIVLNNPLRVVDCEQKGLYAEMFSVMGHKYIYTAIIALCSQQEIHLDSNVLYNSLADINARQAVDALGGIAYIDSLIESRVADNLSLYIEHVKASAIKRLAYNLGGDIQRYILDSPEDATTDVVLDQVQRRVLDLVLENESRSEVYRMGERLEERLRLRLEHPTQIPGLTLGWSRYDRITQGYKGNELTVWVGESKTGKSTILLNHGKKFSIIDRIPGLYIDTEMDDVEQEDRLVSSISGVPYEEIVNGMYGSDTEYGNAADKIRAVAEATRLITSQNFYHVYMPDFTIEKVAALVRKYQIQYGIGYVIFDYIKLPTSEIAGLASAQEYQRLGFMTTCLKDLAGMCNIPVISAAQANRTAIGSTELDANAIGGSYRILQMATRLNFIRNKTAAELASEGLSRGNQKIKVAYQRNGSSGEGEINVMFEKPILRMREVS
jgi:replicative DNA helicase